MLRFPGRCPGLSWYAPLGLGMSVGADSPPRGSQGVALGCPDTPRWGWDAVGRILRPEVPRALPWAVLIRPVGAGMRWVGFSAPRCPGRCPGLS